MLHSIFAMEVCARLDSSLRSSLRERVLSQPAASTYQQKWALYRQSAEELLAHLDHVERGCWDYYDNDARALADYDMWVKGMTTEEGARTSPSGPIDPYRGEARYMTFTMAFLIAQGSPTDRALAALCNIPQSDLWRRQVFARILQGMGVINFASVKSDVVYLIPGEDAWGLTADDLAAEKFAYLRPLV